MKRKLLSDWGGGFGRMANRMGNTMDNEMGTGLNRGV